MKFREACGLAWMVGMFGWQLENVPLLAILVEAKTFADAVIPLVVVGGGCALWSFGIGAIIGWSKTE